MLYRGYRAAGSTLRRVLTDDGKEIKARLLRRVRRAGFGTHGRNPATGNVTRIWTLVETIRTPDGPRQRTLCHLGELNDSAQARWLKTIDIFNEHGDRHQLKLFPSEVTPPAADPDVVQVLLHLVRLEWVRQLGPALLGLALWRQLRLDDFWTERLDAAPADVPWSRVAGRRARWRSGMVDRDRVGQRVADPRSPGLCRRPGDLRRVIVVLDEVPAC